MLWLETNYFFAQGLGATMLTPVPQMFSMSTSPSVTGALARAELISFMQSKIFSLGIGAADLQGTTFSAPPSTLTVEVRLLTG